jgi:hypothetical protein
MGVQHVSMLLQLHASLLGPPTLRGRLCIAALGAVSQTRDGCNKVL